jgi:hypothetical protein
MKSNPPRHWSISLRGAKRTQAMVATFTGTIEAVLSEADVMECQVNWHVRRIEIVVLRDRPLRASAPLR